MLPPYEGGCQCGAIRYEIMEEATVLYACHCTICQTQSGSAFGLSFRMLAESFHLIIGKLKSFVREGNEQTIIGSFCADCGTRIHHTLESQPGVVSLKPGTLDDTSWLPQPVHVWTRSAQPWTVFPADAKMFETGSGGFVPEKNA